MTEEILRWKCPACGQEIKSLYQKQLMFWTAQHKLKHEVENDSNNSK